MLFDTNVLVYAVDANFIHRTQCSRYIERFANGPETGYLTWSICYEFLRVATHLNVLETPLTSREAWGFLEELISTFGFHVLAETERHRGLLAQTLTELPTVSANQMHDLHTAVMMREHNISQICTRDGGFRRFPFLEVIDPLADMTGV